MFHENRLHHNQTSSPSPEPLILLVGMVLCLLLAFPALVAGLLLAQVSRPYRWSLPLWLVLTPCSLGLLLLLIMHGLDARLTTEMAAFVQQAHLHQLDLWRWDVARLWSTLWPVWLSTLPLIPVIAAGRALAAQFQRSAATTLRLQEQERQATVVRAQRRADRRLRRLHPVPDAVHGQLFVGIAIDDEANQ